MSWQIWSLAAIAMFIVEIFAPGFIFGCLGVACACAAAASALCDGFNAQLVAFIGGMLVSFVGIRPFFLKWLHRDEPAVRSNVDALAGKVGHVTERVDSRKNTGRMMVGGDDWKAVSMNDVVIEAGARARVVRVDGAKVIVEPAA